jgi:hypothetical protein
MGRSSDKGTRVDVMFSNDVYEAIQQLAIHDGAKTHHISKKVEVSPTIAKLVRLGLDALDGKLPDNSSELSDKLTGKPSRTLSGNLSDISDKRVEIIVDRRLTELGLFPDRPIEDIPAPHLLPDKNDNVPDNLSVKDVMISDKVDSLPDSLSDTENTPSDDSSNSESIAEDVPITQVNAIEQVSGETTEYYLFGEFHDLLGIPTPARKSKANINIAIATAKDQGLGDWGWNSTLLKFTTITEN